MDARVIAEINTTIKIARTAICVPHPCVAS